METKDNAIRVMVVDDHALVRSGLCCILDEEQDLDVVGEAGSGDEAVSRCSALDPDVVVLGCNLPDGIETARRLLAVCGGVRVVVLSLDANEWLAVRAMRAGASGYVIKTSSSDDLLAAIRKVRRGGTYVAPALMERIVTHLCSERCDSPLGLLTRREREVLVALARGATLDEVAEGMCIAKSTVETHRARILEKLDLRNHAELTLFALQWKLVDLG
jgi:DNA-binding NarL/FixJ family response regulator